MLCFRFKKSKKLIKPKIRKYIISISEIKDNNGVETPKEQPFYYKKVLIKVNNFLTPELKPTKSLKSGITIQVPSFFRNRKSEPQDMKLKFSSGVEASFSRKGGEMDN
ncbi:hypothetical protein SteCoe_11486 [Stentor coeruleus]|uniref:Uncharacterized protein n=1 Tax=Stentor coeruleus TaxID=5963 RepID=A0A1R2CD46_9CILI|nr:hypothetical protein SteCoe_11486 [Stentor coeruleus]